MTENPAKSEFSKMLDANRLEREEEKFRSGVVDRLESIEDRLAALSDKVAGLPSSKQLDRGFDTVRQYLIWLLGLSVGGAIALWKTH